MNRLDTVLLYLQKHKYSPVNSTQSQLFNVDSLLQDLDPFSKKQFLDWAQKAQYICFTTVTAYMGQHPLFHFYAGITQKGEELLYENIFTAAVKKIAGDRQLVSSDPGPNRQTSQWTVEITDQLPTKPENDTMSISVAIRLDNARQGVGLYRIFSQRLAGHTPTGKIPLEWSEAPCYFVISRYTEG